MKTIKLEDIDVADVKWLQYSLIPKECTIKMGRSVLRVIGSEVEDVVKKIKQLK
ncbi:hypothetical protein GCM10028805_22720 [Spirosoma harenae]